ncbi:MAG: hypothetical protein HQK51_19915, partial [Oligoflexia bacterium]|nr:hypothetical protein [Oligoflexia bacterium]
MKKNLYIILCLNVFIIFTIGKAFSCSKFTSKPIELYFTYEGDSLHKEGFSEKFLSAVDSFSVLNCEKASGKFLILQLNPM